MTVDGDELIVDWTGTDPQVRGPINATYGVTAGAVYNAIFHLTDQNIPKNSGAYRPIRIIAPPGIGGERRLPGPVGRRQHRDAPEARRHGRSPRSRRRCPTASAAAEGGTACNFLFGGVHPKTGDYYANYHLEGGGWGAKSYDDGNDAIIVKNGNCRNTPVEIFETRYPLRIVEYSLIADSGGAGRMRGGLGTRRILRVEEGAEVTANALFDRTKPGFGACGPRRRRQGRARRDPRQAQRATSEFRTFSEVYGTVSPSKFTNIRLTAGDEVLIDSPGGGGYGDARERDRERVARDVDEGFVSPACGARALRLGGLSDGRTGSELHAEVWETVVTPCDCCGQVVAEAPLDGRGRGRASCASAASAARQLYREYVIPQRRAGG